MGVKHESLADLLHGLVYSSNIYQGAYYVPGTVLGMWDVSVSQRGKKNHRPCRACPCRLAINKLHDVLEWDEYSGQKSRKHRVRKVREGEEGGDLR